MSKKFSNKKRHIVFSKNNGKCVMCGVMLRLEYYDDSDFGKPSNHNDDGRYMQIDHFLPKSKGGRNDISNLFPICKTCNSKKGTHTIESAILKIEKIKQNAKEEIEKKEELIKLLRAYSEICNEI